jgi:hypothetical protein
MSGGRVPGLPGGVNADVGYKAYCRARAEGFLGLSRSDPLQFEFFEDFLVGAAGAAGAPPGWTQSGSVNVQTPARGGGWIRVATTASAGTTGEVDSFGCHVENISTKKWYFATRFVLNTTPDAASIIFVSLLNIAANKTIGVGFRGSRNANNFIVQYDGIWTGSSIDLGVAKDAAIHLVEVYAVGSTTLRARIDAGAELSAVMASAPSDPIRGIDILSQNGVTAALQSIDTDFVYVRGVRA